MINLLKVNTIFKLIKNCSVYILIFLNISVFSQNQSFKSTPKNNLASHTIDKKDVVTTTKAYLSKKEYKQADIYLSKYYSLFSEDLEINWLYAHVLNLNNNQTEANNKFKKSISITPNNQELKMDYIKFLYQIGKVNEIETVLNDFTIDENSKDVEFLLIQANISFWNGDFKTSKKKIDRIQEIYPNTDLTNNLSNQIEELTGLYLKANFEYQTDSQPMDYFAQHITLEKYVSKLLNPSLEISNYNFSPQSEQAIIAKLGNKMHFNELNLEVNLSAGAYKNFSGDTDWIGGIEFKQFLAENTSIKFGYSKNSVLGTIASTSINLTKEDIFGELDYNNKWIVLHSAYNQQFYQDDNKIKVFGAWIVSQPIKVNKFSFQAGYGFNYTDADDILFVYDSEGLGIYDPYFTPKEQKIHSGLFITNYKPTEKLTIKGKLNYGFSATVRNPYPLEVTPNNFEIGGFYDEEFSYLDIEGAVNYMFSDKFGVNLVYTYQETFFYKRDNINLGVNYRF